jgi:serine/threonine-protein kinase
MICSACQASAPDGSRFCPSCAAPLPPAPDALTHEASPSARAAGVAAAIAQAPGVGRLVSSDTIAVGGFTPGAILANRYRIIGLLGRGGMGEVYRADDLKLGQPVALKFLPRDLAGDPVRRERFIGEVRIARQVSHPNLCRVYDIGEFDDQYFLTMEYIDGEDLASLLRRIGFLHGQKALDIARQLCAGLAAAHDKGVLHRDLKPANVMIDGRGRVRITDFGLALAAHDSQPGEEMLGTPAYMAPEQLAGQGATTRSDIHALGLVLYELYTGRRTFNAQSLAELRAEKAGDTPVAPSEIARDMDPVVERVIMRCLERDPRLRPSSAAQVAAALPGGDPLAAALAAGETPSPEMVAASGSSEGFSPRVAWLALALVIAGVVATVPLMERTQIYRRVALDRPPEALADRARQILIALGQTDPPADSKYGFVVDQSLVDYVARHDPSPARWDHLPAETIRFFYRQRATGPLMREGFLTAFLLTPGTRSFDPPMSTSGDVLVWLDPHGRLLELVSVPPELEDPSRPAASPDWTVLFREASLDVTQWTPTAPRYVPAFYAGLRAAWAGTSPDRPQDQIHLED